MPVVGRNQSAQVLDIRGRLLLIDCGEGLQQALVRYHVPIQKIEVLLLSHIHGDHVFGIFGLLSTMGMLGRSSTLHIFAPGSFGPILKFFLSYYGDGLKFDIDFHKVDCPEPEVVWQTRTVEVLAFPLNHKIETYGYMVREKEPMLNVDKDAIARYGLTLTEIGTLKRGEDVVRPDGVIPNSEAAYKPFEPRSYAYVSDTAPFPQLPGWLSGVDLLYHEATYTEEFTDQAALRHHSTARQAALCAKQAGAGKLLIGHYSSRCRDIAIFERQAREVFPDVTAVSDGDVFDIPEKARKTSVQE